MISIILVASKKLVETSQCFGRKLTRGEISQRLNKGRRLIHQCHHPQIARHNFNALDIIRIKGRWGIGRAIRQPYYRNLPEVFILIPCILHVSLYVSRAPKAKMPDQLKSRRWGERWRV